MSKDIAVRLREWSSTICTIRGDETPGSKSRMAREAADEIERLRAKIAEASDEAQLARSTVTDLTIEVEKLRDELSARNAYESCKTLMELRQRIETLTAERDEARREIVVLLAGTDIAAMHRFADERGWDCFKEGGK